MNNGYLELSSDMHFLLVDEMPTYREVLTHILKKLGFKEIFHATSATIALNVIKREDIGFVICERKLRGMSGIEFLKEIRESPEVMRTPFVLAAASISREDVVLATEIGVDGYLKKPYVMSEVSARLSGSMSRYLDPLNPEIEYDAAKKCLLEKDFEKAKNSYEKIISRSPDSARAMTGKAKALKGQGKLEEAAVILNNAITANPMYVHAHHLLGVTCMELGDKEKALEHLSSAIEISPSNPIRYETVSELLISTKHYAEAEDYLKKAVSLELAYPNLYSQLGRVMFAQKKSQEAANYFEKALQEQPKNTSFLNSMGICMKELGRFDEAMSYYNMALKLLPGDTKILFNKSLLLITLKQYPRAIKSLEQILKVDPSYEKAKKKIAEVEKLMRS